MKTTQFDTSWYVEQEARIAAASTLARTASRCAPAVGQLYVVEFTSGVIKVGKAIRAETRIANHALYARVHGGDVSRSWASDRHSGYDATEQRLIAGCKAMGEHAFGREYFRGLAFERACNFAGMVVLDRRRRDYLDSLIAAVDEDLSVTWLEAQRRANGGAA